MVRQIQVPRVHVVTTFGQELRYYESLLEQRMVSYGKGFTGGTAEGVVQILLAHTKKGVGISPEHRGAFVRTADVHIRRGVPIPVTLSLFIGARINNGLKFRELVPFPTLGWMHLAFFLRLLNEKVKTVYLPGLRVILFDEATLLASLGSMDQLDPDGVAACLRTTREIMRAMGAPVEVIEVLADYFPQEEVRCIPVLPVEDEEVYAEVCTLPQMTNPTVMDAMYVSRQRDYGALRAKVGDSLWEDARRNCEMLRRCLEYRKQVGLFARLAGVDPVIDATITEKTGRIVLDITSGAFLNHGMPVVRRNLAGTYKLRIVPEYRIPTQHPLARQVQISPSEFGCEGAPCTFYYVEE